jgi:dTDP-4-dehydrorhamnose reductase
MKVLVTGGGGQLAHWVTRTAPADAAITKLERRELDVADGTAVDAAVAEIAPDIIFNCAGYTKVDLAESEPEQAFAVNQTGSANLARAASAAGSRLVHVSTDFVFDGASATPYRPNDRPAPLNVYGASKLAGERAAAAMSDDLLIVRTAWLYSLEGDNFVTKMLRAMTERDEIRVVSDQVGTPTHCRSLARALWELAIGGSRGIHHFTDAGVASWYDFAVAISEEGRAAGLLGRDPAVIPIATADFQAAARRPAFSLLDKAETWTALGWRPSHWRTELREAFGTPRG